MSIIDADTIRKRAAKLYDERTQKVTDDLMKCIIQAIERFDKYIERCYSTDELHPDMCYEIIKQYLTAGYKVYYYVKEARIRIFITWHDIHVPRRYLSNSDETRRRDDRRSTKDRLICARSRRVRVAYDKDEFILNPYVFDDKDTTHGYSRHLVSEDTCGTDNLWTMIDKK